MGIRNGESREEHDAAIPDAEAVETTCFVRRGIINARERKLVQHTEGGVSKVVDLAMSGVDSALSAPGTARNLTGSLASRLVGTEATLRTEATPSEARPS